MSITLKREKFFCVRKILAAVVLVSSVAAPVISHPSCGLAAPGTPTKRTHSNMSMRDMKSKSMSMDNKMSMDKMGDVGDYNDDSRSMNGGKTWAKVTMAGHLGTAFSVGTYDKYKDTTGEYEVNRTLVAIPSLTLQTTGEVMINNASVRNTKVGAVVRMRIGRGFLAQDTDAVATVGAAPNFTTIYSSHVQSDTPAAVNFDRAYIFAQSHWGEVQLGAVDNPSHFMHYTAPAFIKDNNIDEPGLLNISGTVAAVKQSTYANMSRRANKVAYYTPRVSGFQVGVAFTPEGSASGASNFNVPLVRKPFDDFTQNTVQSVGDLAANYVFQHKQFDLGVDAFVSKAMSVVPGSSTVAPAYTPVPHGSPMEMGLGAQMAYHVDSKKTFRFGGAFRQGKDILIGSYNKAYKGDKSTILAIGAEYDIESWSFGISMIRGDGSSDVAARHKSRTQAVKFGTGYTFQEGLNVGFDINMTENKFGSDKKLKGVAANIYAGLDF